MKKLIIAITILLSSALLPLGPGQSDASATFSSNSVNKIINTGKKYIGTPYKWGGNTPKGFDCSGFVKYTIKKATGKTVPRTSAALYQKGKKISKSNLKKGDLLFFNTSGKGVSHVAIYMGNNQMIHAASKGVKVDKLSNSYWNKRYVGAKRI